MNKTSKEFYKNSIVIRRTIVELIFRNHDGRGFTQEKIASSQEEFGPINDRVMHFTEEKVKKL